MEKIRISKRRKIAHSRSFPGMGNYKRLKGTGDQRLLREMFPDEIWLMIFAHVIDALLYYKICRVSKHFFSMIQPLRLKILFPSVASILFKNLNRGFGYGRLEPLPKCRQICTNWQFSVDSFLQSSKHHNLRFHHQYNPAYYIHNFRRPGCQIIKTSEDIETFQAHFNRETHLHSGRNPFLFRSLYITIVWDENTAANTEIVNNLITFLDSYGVHVWYLKIYVYIRDRENELQFVVSSVIERLLERMPNIKKIEFDWMFNMRYKPNWESALEIYFRENRMPHLKYLKVLVCSGIPDLLISNLVSRNPTIQELKCAMRKLNNDPVIQLRHLRSLHTLVFQDHDLHQIEFSKAFGSLTKLELDFGSLGVPWCDVFRVLGDKYAKTLEQLSIVLGVSEAMKIPCGLALPKLQYLYVKLRNFVPLNFLLPMSDTLQHLAVSVKRDHLEHSPESVIKNHENVIKFYSCRKELHRSNIWQIFTKLQTLKCECEVDVLRYEEDYCTRRKWKQYSSPV